MPDNFIDLTVTSPPYDNLRDYKGYSFDFENVAKELFRVTKQGSAGNDGPPNFPPPSDDFMEKADDGDLPF